MSLRSVGTSQRDVFDRLGNSGYTYVATGNGLASRVVLLLYICSWKKLRWVVEQPGGSVFADHPRFQEFLQVAHATW